MANEREKKKRSLYWFIEIGVGMSNCDLPSGPDSQHASLCGSSCPFLSGQKSKVRPNSSVVNCLSISLASTDL